ncbi:hypothetical protein PHYPSEUDO_009318 [Phytophthora pseudosyringae]|uniref:Uncharacterized protein n=1 Tax=Phytophthora pseudosyringae TaxID=221518 RepID=A0A8T1VFG6_9STRA|nr:hypothetical protein PHYPSEUDO_009318 [Phytophthora pseudosyringae]
MLREASWYYTLHSTISLFDHKNLSKATPCLASALPAPPSKTVLTSKLSSRVCTSADLNMKKCRVGIQRRGLMTSTTKVRILPALYAGDVPFQQNWCMGGSIKENGSCYSGKHHLYGLKVDVSVNLHGHS